jgi:ABC-type transport system involved in multi-copper enzyme maturation permease subunit
MTASMHAHHHHLAAATSALPPIPFSRLVGVEWTKATDTRAARWLLALVGLSTVGMMLAPILARTRFDQTFTGYLEVASTAPVILLPVVGILMLTGEWSRRSVITTFTQEPRRIRVVFAKVVASLMLGLGAASFSGLVAAAGFGVAAASGRTMDGSLGVGDLAGYLVYLLLNMLGGVAAGVLLQSSTTAIAAYFALNVGVALLGTASTLIADWIDTSTTWPWVLDNDWDGHVPQIAVSTLIWVVVPIVAGVIRTRRRDVA